MRIIVWLFWSILFLVFFAFSLDNTASTELHLFGKLIWQAPLIALLLFFFLAGVVFGLLAFSPVWFRQRVELRRLRRSLASLSVANEPASAQHPATSATPRGATRTQ
jgi:lipopolysaccharide assembly protein A